MIFNRFSNRLELLLRPDPGSRHAHLERQPIGLFGPPVQAPGRPSVHRGSRQIDGFDFVDAGRAGRRFRRRF